MSSATDRRPATPMARQILEHRSLMQRAYALPGELFFPLVFTLLAGLALTSGAGVLLIGRFNLISVAFAALFIGLGVDFGIQYSVRYREERHAHGHLDTALQRAAVAMGPSLTLAAIAPAACFFSFVPTDYSGLAELGFIAGSGMIVAYLLCATMLPALLKLMNPQGEMAEVGFVQLAREPLERRGVVALDREVAVEDDREERARVTLADQELVDGEGPALGHLGQVPEERLGKSLEERDAAKVVRRLLRGHTASYGAVPRAGSESRLAATRIRSWPDRSPHPPTHRARRASPCLPSRCSSRTRSCARPPSTLPAPRCARAT